LQLLKTLYIVICNCSILVKQENFVNREFSFTLHEDIYIRYQSFNTLKDFETEIQNKCPFKIDIGAVFNMRFVLNYDYLDIIY